MRRKGGDVNARTIGRIAAVLTTVSALTALAGVAQAGTSRPPSMSKAEYRSLMLRSEALDQEYGLGPQRAVPQGLTAAGYRALLLRSKALDQEYGLGPQRAVPQGLTAAEYPALTLRSEALNKRYGLDKQKAAAVTSQTTNATRGFAWGAFGIGAAVMFGLALLAGGFFVRRRLLATLRGLAPRYGTT
jgi:hypothetical protein